MIVISPMAWMIFFIVPTILESVALENRHAVSRTYCYCPPDFYILDAMLQICLIGGINEFSGYRKMTKADI